MPASRHKKSCRNSMVKAAASKQNKLNREAIIAIFKQPGEKKQQAVIRTIAQSGKEGLALISELLSPENSISIRRWATEALGYFSGKAVDHLLTAALQDPAMSVRLHAIHAIKRVRSAQLARKLLPLMQDESGGIRINCLDAIVSLQVPGYKAVIMATLKDEKDYLRKRAAYYLDNFGK